MTRFARAKGSKASNERVFSDPTPWAEMKNQMLKRKQEIEEEKNRREAEAKRNENYQKFLRERKEENTPQTQWAEFPEETESKQNGLSKKSKTIQKQKNKVFDKNLKQQAAMFLETTEETKSGDNGKVKNKEITKNEGNTEILVKKPKKKLKIITDNEVTVSEVNNEKTEEEKNKRKSKSKNGLKQNKTHSRMEDTHVILENDDVDDDDTPMETSSKVEVSEPVVKKVKSKKKKLKIPNSEPNKEEKKDDNDEKKDEDNEKKVKNVGNKIRKNIDFSSLTEEEQRKIIRKREKRRKQVEKKNLKKKQNQEQEGENKVNKPDESEGAAKSYDRTKFNKSAEKFNNRKLNGAEMNKQLKKPKLENGDFKRRKDLKPDTIFVNGNEVELKYVDGFPIKKEDAENLQKLKKEMISKGLPRNEINRTLKLERRKAEKALAREKKKVCFNCRNFGHNLSDCPKLSNKDELVDTSGAGICFKCGSTEHTSFACRVVQGQNFKFATCFICKEQGHISKQCPDNARGLYPKGGSCRVCGDVTHLKKDCPKYQEQQKREEDKYRVESIYDRNPEDMEPSRDIPKNTVRPKIIKF